jgi:glutathione S-transferase
LAEFELYCFAESGNAYKAALMLNLCDADWQARFVDYLGGETRTNEYRRTVNEMGEIPVLVHGQRKFTQSGAILNYLSKSFGRYGAQNEQQEHEILGWLLFDNHKFTSYAASLRFLLKFTDTGETPVTEFLRGRAQTAFAIVENHLSNHEFMVAERPTIADISMCGYLFWPEQLSIDWPQHPHIRGWLERIRELPGWRHPYDLMPHAAAAG